ncbi:hypothetical protein [Haloarcula nitratireducens]|uniref:Transposase n=1 Tax=Haloarcula nitratireducens TaxID=2487749 RepID=A0AAW4PL32_9EURY|nr:hypothetical protein [Halomicroarcula nitratireducens]MBX0298010.1 hypothetical protein [Halomicroarcula nitratireducens]
MFWDEVEKHVVLCPTLRTSMHEMKAVLITLFYTPLRPGAGDVSTLLAAFWMILEVRLHEVDE